MEMRAWLRCDQKNRESLRDLKIQELLDSGCVFLKEYPDYIISEAKDF